MSAWSWLSFSNETIWKEKTQLSSLLVHQLFLASLFQRKESVFCIFCIRHKGKLTAEHNIEEAYITKGFNNWKSTLEAFVDHQQSKAHRAAIKYESIVPQCGDALEMTVNDLNNKHLAERKYLIKVMECMYSFSSTPRNSFQR